MIGCHEMEVYNFCLKSCGVFYFSNMFWNHIPDPDCSEIAQWWCDVDCYLIFCRKYLILLQDMGGWRLS